MLKNWLNCAQKSGVTLYLNIYDLTPINGYLYWLGLGIYHSAVEAHGREYAFGAHDFSSSGVFEVEPQSCPGFQFRRKVKLGTCNLDIKEFEDFMVQIASEYSGNTYHLILNNCNHFCNDVSLRLTGSPIPGWVNRLANLGNLCNCFLPDELDVKTVAPALNNGDGSNSSNRSSRPLCAKKPKRRRQKVVVSPLEASRGRRQLPSNQKQPTFAALNFKTL